MYNFTPVFSLFLEYFRGQDVFPSLEEMSLIARRVDICLVRKKNLLPEITDTLTLMLLAIALPRVVVLNYNLFLNVCMVKALSSICLLVKPSS